jgi:organic radical activating enzyme
MTTIPESPRNIQRVEKPIIHPRGLLDIVNVFLTIQGEGPFSGYPAVFIRMAGCTLRCPQCFGVALKTRIPYLTRSFGPQVQLHQVQEGETILTFDEDLNLVETIVQKVIQRKVKEWFEIKIDGYTYDVTPEHPFFTTRGLVIAEDLEVGDFILDCRPEEVISYKKLGKRNPMKDPEVSKRRVQNTDFAALGRSLSKTLKRKQKEGTYKHPTELISYDKYKAMKERISLSKRREKNPNWKGKSPNLLDLYEKIKNGEITKCQKCRKKKLRLLIHHKDDNHNNDQKKNLVVWCHSCHNQHHERGYNFWNGTRKDGKELIKKHNGQKVEKITHCTGKLPVINISCAPYNTYLANGMWVHNCDTDYTKNRHLRTSGQIVDTVQEIRKQCLVVITGGEPFRQNIMPLVRLLLNSGYHVQIETNGMHIVDKMPWSKITVVCSPKVNKIHPDLPINCYKYVLSKDFIDEEDGLPTSVLGLKIRPARPKPNIPIYVSPADEGDPGKNEANLRATIQSVLKFGYILSVQNHKLWDLP